MDLNSWEQKGVVIKWENQNDYGIGRIIWSPDEKYILYFTFNNIIDETTGNLIDYQCSIVRLDLDSFIQTVISREPMYVYSTEWADDGRLWIHTDGDYLLLDPLTGELESTNKP